MPPPKDTPRTSRAKASGGEASSDKASAGRKERWFEAEPGAALQLDVTLTGGEAAVVRRWGSPNVTIASALRHALRESCEVAEAKRRVARLELVAHRQADYLGGLVDHMNQLSGAMARMYQQQTDFLEHYRHPGGTAQPVHLSEQTEATLRTIDHATQLLVSHLEVLDHILSAAVKDAAREAWERGG